MSENRERGWMAFHALLMIGMVAWCNWSVINTDRNNASLEPFFWLIAAVLLGLIFFLCVLVVAGLLNKDPFGLSGQHQKLEKDLTPKERRKLQRERRLFDKL